MPTAPAESSKYMKFFTHTRMSTFGCQRLFLAERQAIKGGDAEQHLRNLQPELSPTWKRTIVNTTLPLMESHVAEINDRISLTELNVGMSALVFTLILLLHEMNSPCFLSAFRFTCRASKCWLQSAVQRF